MYFAFGSIRLISWLTALSGGSLSGTPCRISWNLSCHPCLRMAYSSSWGCTAVSLFLLECFCSKFFISCLGTPSSVPEGDSVCPATFFLRCSFCQEHVFSCSGRLVSIV